MPRANAKGWCQGKLFDQCFCFCTYLFRVQSLMIITMLPCWQILLLCLKLVEPNNMSLELHDNTFDLCLLHGIKLSTCLISSISRNSTWYRTYSPQPTEAQDDIRHRRQRMQPTYSNIGGDNYSEHHTCIGHENTDGHLPFSGSQDRGHHLCMKSTIASSPWARFSPCAPRPLGAT